MTDHRKTKAQLIAELNALRQHVVELEQRSGAPITDQLTPPVGHDLLALIDNADGSIWSIDRQYRLMVGNELFHRGVSGVLGRRLQPGESVLLSALPPAALAEWQNYYDRALQGERFNAVTATRLTSQPLTVEHHFSPIVGPDGAITGVAVFGRDITAHKQIETTLHEREQKLRQVLDILPVGISILDADRNVVFENPALERILELDRTGLRQGTYQQRAYLAADGTPMPADGFASVQAAQRGRVVSNVETGVITENGQMLWTNVSAVPVDFPDWKTVVAVVDITERKRAEQALRESEARYRLIADNTADVIWVLNPATGQFTYVSPSVEKLRGYTPEEVMAQPIQAALTPDSLQRVSDSLAQTLPAFLAQGGPSEAFVHKVDQPCRDGSIVHTEVTTRYVINERGEVEIIGVSRDISARQRAEEALRQSEERHRLIASLTSDYVYAGVIYADQTTRTDWISGAFEAITGYTSAEIIGRQNEFLKRVVPEDLAVILSQGTRLFEQRQSVLEYRIRRQDGQIRWLRDRIKYVIDDSPDQPVRFIGAVQDITERRQAEQAMQEQQHFISAVVNTSPAIIYVYDLELRRISFANQGLAQILGYAPDQVLAMDPNLLANLIDPADRPRLNAFQANALTAADGEILQTEYRARHRDGSERVLHVYESPFLRRPDGSLKQKIGVSIDVTENKRAEIALRESEQKYSLLFHQAAIPAVLVQLPEKIIVDANEAFEHTLGYSRSEVLGRNSVHIGLISRAERDRVFDEFQRGLLTQGDEMQLLNKAGDTLTVVVKANQVDIGDHAYAIVTLHDLTERKRAEEQVQALSRQLIELQEAERRTLARELHDEIGQALTAVKMNLQAMQLTTDPAIHDKRWADSVHIVERTLRQTRDLALDLRPSLLDDFGLESALDWYLKREAERAGIPIEFVVEPHDLRLPAVLETTCYRLVQSAVTNIVRHAQARQARVELRRINPRQAELIIEDDGAGFDVPQALAQARQGDSLGLVAMHERVQLAGGSLELTSAPQHGTRIRAVFQVTE